MDTIGNSQSPNYHLSSFEVLCQRHNLDLTKLAVTGASDALTQKPE